MTDSNPTERFLSIFLQDWVEGNVRAVESYLREFPPELETVIRAALDNRPRQGESKSSQKPLAAEAGRQVGHYVIRKELGRGGQGIVFLAHDMRLGREVALKVLTSWGQAPPKVLSRFQREASIASKLEHPGICTVYETGEADGVPFLAMQYVRGESLSRKISAAALQTFADNKDFLNLEISCTEEIETELPTENPTSKSTNSRSTAPPIRQTIRVIEKTARALHAAHEIGIVHRDIKPGNIIVDAIGNPIILDFGLAREIDGDQASLTQTGDLFGTPAYMAPEQLMAKRIRVDRRADIWSLGVTLYERLSLARPFVAPTRESLFQAILTKEPPNLRKLNTDVPKDLKVIVGMAVEKDRDRRYATAQDFADDLRRFMEKKPIAARPIGLIGHLTRWGQRNPAVAVLALLLFVSMTAGLIRITSQNRQLQTKTNEAQLSLAELSQEQTRTAALLKHAEAVKDFLNDDLLGGASPLRGKKDVLARDLLDRAAQDIKKKFKDSPLIAADIRNTIGQTYLDLGLWSLAEPQLVQALEIRSKYLGREDPKTLNTMNNLGRAFEFTGKPEKALSLLREAFETSMRVQGKEHGDTIAFMMNVALLHQNQGRPEIAMPLYTEALEISRRTLGTEDRRTISILNNLGLLNKRHGKYDQAMPLYKEALQLCRKVHGPDHPYTLSTAHNLAVLHKVLGEPDLALPLYKEALEGSRRVRGARHPDTLASLYSTALLLRIMGRMDESQPLFEEGAQLYLEVHGADDLRTLQIQAGLGICLIKQKLYERAEKILLDVYQRRLKLLSPQHSTVHSSLRGLSTLYSEWGKPEEAASWQEKLPQQAGKTPEKKQ